MNKSGKSFLRTRKDLNIYRFSISFWIEFAYWFYDMFIKLIKTYIYISSADFLFLIKSDRHLGVEAELSPHMLEIGIRSPVATDLSRKKRYDSSTAKRSTTRVSVTGPRRWPLSTVGPCRSRCGMLNNPHCSMATRSKFAALHRQWWRLHTSEKFSSLEWDDNSKLTYPTLQHFLKVLHIMNVNAIIGQKIIIDYW